jgi:monoamine oxidase
MPRTTDPVCFLYADDRIETGLETPAVTPTTFVAGAGTKYDVIVVGAGFAGLCCARDLSRSGKKVLLLEARDRIGGRTYTSPRHGMSIEMGGTWVHWSQPHVFHELHQYGLQGDLKRTIGTATPATNGPSHIYVLHKGKLMMLEYGEYERRFDAALRKFVNVDGEGGRLALEYPHDYTRNRKETAELERRSCADRMEELKGELDELDVELISAFLGTIGCCALEKLSLFDALRWWALPGYDTGALFEATCTWKLKSGTTKLAQCILGEFRGDTLFSSPVANIDQTSDGVAVTTTNGHKISASQVVCTVPLNVLHSISFNPPLSKEKVAASKEGQVNRGVKVHLYTPTVTPTFSTNSAPPNSVLFGFSESNVPNGGSFSVFFCQEEQLDTSSPQSLVKSFKSEVEGGKLLPGKVEVGEIMCHDWVRDQFARGLWCAYAPGFWGKYFDALQKREGRVWFASADWADGNRGFIDGAIEQGCRIARALVNKTK